MLVRQATRDDLPGILGIYNEAVLNTTASYDYEPSSLETRTAWYDEHVRGGYPVFVAEDESGRVVGWSSLSPFRTRFGYRFTAEDSVYVASDRRGKGVGTLLLTPLIESARAKGLHAIIAAVDADNEPSLRLHSRFGFEKVARLPQIGFKFERWLDVVYLELLLP